MNLHDLNAKLTWFEKNPHRVHEPYKDWTLFEELCQTVENYFAEQSPERFGTPEWEQETEEIMRRLGRIETNGKILRYS